jgi:hypothetical protein
MPALKQKLLSGPEFFGDWGDDIKDPEHYTKLTPLHMLPM